MIRQDTKVPQVLTWSVVAICLVPLLLNWVGVDFATHEDNFDIHGDTRYTPVEVVDVIHHALRGSFVHTILECGAFIAAFFTVVLTFVSFHIKREVATPIIGVALFCAGCIDAFHILTADRLIEVVADNHNLIPFTWAISRIFNALIMIMGICVFTNSGRFTNYSGKNGLSFVFGVSLFFGFGACGIIYFCATSELLPEIMFPNGVIHRPWDIAPLLLYVWGWFVFRRLYRKSPSVFAHSLVISIVPQVATQLYMAFGSTMHFDNAFNIAHFLKFIAYIVPFAGLCLDYIQTHRVKEILMIELQDQTASLNGVVETAVNAIITIAQNGEITLFNQAAEKMFGYSATEVLGQNVNILMPDPYRSKHDDYLSNYLSTRVKKIIGTGREVPAQRKDGSIFPIFLSVGEADKDGEVFFVACVVDITEHKKTEADLVAAKEKAEEASRLKSEFLNTMSHELRTPLTAILGNVPLLTDPADLTDAEETAEIARDILRNAEHLFGLINDLLDISKVEAGKLILGKSVVSTKIVVAESIDLIKVLAKQKKLALDLNVIDFDLLVDPIRLKQILVNLLGNAVKFTDIGSVAVSTWQSHDRAYFHVSDTGCGIRSEDLPFVFDVFRQVDSSSTRKASGSGLGLAITHKLVGLHGGEISVESEIGRGSTFYFWLPLGRFD